MCLQLSVTGRNTTLLILSLILYVTTNTTVIFLIQVTNDFSQPCCPEETNQPCEGIIYVPVVSCLGQWNPYIGVGAVTPCSLPITAAALSTSLSLACLSEDNRRKPDANGLASAPHHISSHLISSRLIKPVSFLLRLYFFPDNFRFFDMQNSVTLDAAGLSR